MRRRQKLQSSLLAPAIGFWGGSWSSLILVLLSVCLLVFSAANTQVVSGFRAKITDIVMPVFEVVNAPIQGAANFVRDVTGLAQIQSQNLELRAENEKLRHWYHKAMVLEQENNALRDLLNVELKPHHTYITGRVITDSNNAYVKTLLVSRGSKDGVKTGQAVLSGDGLIGRTIETGENASRILLVNDINSRIPVFIEGTGENAILAGRNTPMPALEHLPPKSKVKDGARVMTSGLGGVFPAGLPIGRLTMTKDGSRVVSLYADFDRLMYVRIVNAPEHQYFIRK